MHDQTHKVIHHIRAYNQAMSHSVKTILFNETAGSKSTKHPIAAFTQNRDTEVTFQDVTFSFQVPINIEPERKA